MYTIYIPTKIYRRLMITKHLLILENICDCLLHRVETKYGIQWYRSITVVINALEYRLNLKPIYIYVY